MDLERPENGFQVLFWEILCSGEPESPLVRNIVNSLPIHRGFFRT
jgi:hypothetical protein